MLFAVAPGPRVSGVFSAHIDTIAMTFVELVEAFISPAIGVVLHAEAVDLLILPITSELTAISELVRAETFNDRVDIIARVRLTIWPFLDSVSIAFSFLVVTHKSRVIWPLFSTNSIGDVAAECAFKAEVIDVD